MLSHRASSTSVHHDASTRRVHRTVAVVPPFRTKSRQHPNRLNSSVAPQHGEAPSAKEKLLEAIKGTDGGMDMSDARRDEVDALIDVVSAAGVGSRPVKDPRLLGNYVVAYTSTRRAPSENGSPSGGRFRGRIGRALFQTTGLFQSVMLSDGETIACNKVAFKLFGCLPGFVGLRGRVEPVGEADDTVKVFFEPPVLSLADSLHLRIGPTSSVTLSTPYLDDNIRVGRGSRGSLFVFTRGGPADDANMELIGLQGTTPSGLAALNAFFAGLCCCGAALWASGNPLLRVASVGAWLLVAGIGAVLFNGGMIKDVKGIERVAAAPA